MRKNKRCSQMINKLQNDHHWPEYTPGAMRMELRQNHEKKRVGKGGIRNYNIKYTVL